LEHKTLTGNKINEQLVFSQNHFFHEKYKITRIKNVMMKQNIWQKKSCKAVKNGSNSIQKALKC